VACLEQKINCRLGCDTHKNIRAIGLKSAQENNDKYEQRRTQSKAEGRHWSFPPAEAVCGAQIVLPNEFLQNDELLCLGTILALTCPASCQPSCSPLPARN
jgi:hypothetical protein